MWADCRAPSRGTVSLVSDKLSMPSMLAEIKHSNSCGLGYYFSHRTHALCLPFAFFLPVLFIDFSVCLCLSYLWNGRKCNGRFDPIWQIFFSESTCPSVSQWHSLTRPPALYFTWLRHRPRLTQESLTGLRGRPDAGHVGSEHTELVETPAGQVGNLWKERHTSTSMK